MDFLLNNDVEFQYDQGDNTYVATIKITNKQENDQPQTIDYQQEQEVVSGMDQMRQFQNGAGKMQYQNMPMMEEEILGQDSV